MLMAEGPCQAAVLTRRRGLTAVRGVVDDSSFALRQMSWVTATWSAAAGASIVLALVHLFIWSQDRRSWANLCFALMVIGPLGLAVGELATMNSESPEAYGRAMQWTHLFHGVGVLGALGFIHFYFGTGRVWLLALAASLRLLAVVANFASGGLNLHITSIYSLQKITFLGEQVSVLGEWVPSSWALLGQLASLVQLAYVADASVRLWRTDSRESRRSVIIVGGSLGLFIVGAAVQPGLVASGILRMPFIVSLPFLGLVLAMSSELSREVVRTAQLSRSLRESEQQMALATEAANLGIWYRYLPGNQIWANSKWRELYGFTASERLDIEGIMDRLHPDDRGQARQALVTAVEGSGHYNSEYRVVHPDGQIRWLASRGDVEFNKSQPSLVRGASIDISLRKVAEEAAHGLSGRLIHAQEIERMRLARELHDDVNQGLALIAVELDILEKQPPAHASEASGRIQKISNQVRGLSSSVHRMSHGLHPAKLQQLGLVPAVRGLCRELGAAHNIAIEFATTAVPRGVPEDIALCLYRIVQEGLQNVIRHSGSSRTQVELTLEERDLVLVIADQGRGFDPAATTGEESLGLISMRERVRLTQGQIAVQSRLGEGTQIVVRIPFACS
jgi:PAS domain S-box-containing protein